MLVHSNVELIGSVAQNTVSRIVIEEPGVRWKRIKVEQLDRIRIEPAGGKDVSRERRHDASNRVRYAACDGTRGGRIKNLAKGSRASEQVGTRAALREQLGEIGVAAVSLKHCWDRVDKRYRLANARAFVVPEEKSLVLADGSADREAELILAVLSLGNAARVLEEVCGIQGVVAQELPDVAMEFVGPGFNGRIQDGASGSAGLRTVVVRLHLEFRNGVNRRLHRSEERRVGKECRSRWSPYH